MNGTDCPSSSISGRVGCDAGGQGVKSSNINYSQPPAGGSGHDVRFWHAAVKATAASSRRSPTGCRMASGPFPCLGAKVGR